MHNTFTINCKGQLIDIRRPKVMGILNCTPDSFFDGGQYNQLDSALFQVEKMLEDGADFIDIGGMSSRPNAEIISIDEEKQRVLPIIEAINQKFPTSIISIDTFRSEIAKEAVQAGAAIVNDISGGNLDEKMFESIAKLQCPYIMMHMQGTPTDMQVNPQYENITLDIAKVFSEKINQLKQLNVNDIILDPGFGFGKTIAHNYQLLREMALLEKTFGLPILVGLSRKSMIWKVLNKTPQEALVGTITAQTIALQNGAKILRVHDVAAARDSVKIFGKYI